MQKIHPLKTLLFTLFALIAASAAAQEVSVTDLLGRTVTLEAPATRVVSLLPSHTSTVLALGAEDVLVAVDDFSNLPADLDLPRAGNAFTPNLEVIVGFTPDLVLVDQYSGIHVALEDLGIAAYAGFAEDLDGVMRSIADLGVLLDAQAEAVEVTVTILADLEYFAELTEGRELVTVYAEADSSLYAAGPASWLGQLIAAAGGVSIVPPEAGVFPQLSAEFIVEADPDVIILLDAPWGESLETLRERPGWSGLTAVQEGRVVEVTQEEADMLSQAGPAAGRAVAQLVRWLHPGLLPD